MEMRPLAIGEIECRLVGATFMTLHKQELATVFEAELQYAIGTPAVCELLAMIVQLHRAQDTGSNLVMLRTLTTP